MSDTIFEALKSKIEEKNELKQEVTVDVTEEEKKAREDKATVLDTEISKLLEDYILQSINGPHD